ncbi:MAG: hypothetical protein H6Q02_1947 [Acidobacteria bacterium]|nr:hypothetical protein [Acidobacteriota bacterium]
MTAALLLATALAAAPSPRVGVDVTIAEPTVGTVVAVAGKVRVASEVRGDVVALLGDVELAPGARVHGDVLALGGRVDGPGRATGRVVGFTALREPSPAGGAANLGLALMRAGGWVVLVTLLVLAAPWSVRRAADGLAHPARAAAVGLLSLAVWLALMVLALGSATTAPGVVAVLTGVGLLLAVKLVGVAGLAWLTGRRLARLLPVALRGEVARTGLAMLLLAVLALLPVVGELLWVVAGVTGIGAVVTAWARPVPVLVAAARALT